PHSVVGCPWRAIRAANAVPQEPAPRTATGTGVAVASFMPTAQGSGGAPGLGVAEGTHAALPAARGTLAPALGAQRQEVDRLQQERSKATGLDQAADQLAGVRVEDVRAMHAEHRVQLLRLEAGDAEQAGLLDLDQVSRLLADGAIEGHAQHHLVGIVAD